MSTTSPASTSRLTIKADSDGFQFVRSKRRPRGTPNANGKNVSNSNGSITGPTSGFAYASASSNSRAGRKIVNGRREREGEQEKEQKAMERAVHAIDVFVRYLGSELGLDVTRDEGGGGGGAQTFASELARVVKRVWSIDESSSRCRTDAEAQTTRNSSPQPNAEESPDEPPSSSQASTAPPLPRRIVCLGLGSPTTSRSAQIQLALLIVLRSWLERQLPHSNQSSSTALDSKTIEGSGVECLAFDPVFSAADTALLERYDVRTLSHSLHTEVEQKENDQERPPQSIETFYTAITESTLLYMPHCDRGLYEELLSLNYSVPSKTSQSEARSPIMLLCNTLSNYQTTTSDQDLIKTAPTLHRLIPQFKVEQLPNWEGGKKGMPLVRRTKTEKEDGTGEEGVENVVGEFGRLWDRNALRDLAFHWM
ncbi:SRR1 domain-containing protein [Pseudozyma hubeiensis]|nr:SRR1 domain-containing protein [Pseudozyma hubeiensis]